jgi:hypothetical protein
MRDPPQRRRRQRPVCPAGLLSAAMRWRSRSHCISGRAGSSPSARCHASTYWLCVTSTFRVKGKLASRAGRRHHSRRTAFPNTMRRPSPAPPAHVDASVGLRRRVDRSNLRLQGLPSIAVTIDHPALDVVQLRKLDGFPRKKLKMIGAPPKRTMARAAPSAIMPKRTGRSDTSRSLQKNPQQRGSFYPASVPRAAFDRL